MEFNKPKARQARIKDPINAHIGTHDSLLEAGQFIVTLVRREKSMMTSAKAVIPGLTRDPSAQRQPRYERPVCGHGFAGSGSSPEQAQHPIPVIDIH